MKRAVSTTSPVEENDFMEGCYETRLKHARAKMDIKYNTKRR